MCFPFKKKCLEIVIVSLFHPNLITCGYICKPTSHDAVCSLDTNWLLIWKWPMYIVNVVVKTDVTVTTCFKLAHTNFKWTVYTKDIYHVLKWHWQRVLYTMAIYISIFFRVLIINWWSTGSAHHILTVDCTIVAMTPYYGKLCFLCKRQKCVTFAWNMVFARCRKYMTVPMLSIIEVDTLSTSILFCFRHLYKNRRWHLSVVVVVVVVSQFNGTLTPKGSYRAKTGDNDCNVNSSRYSLRTALCESIRYQAKSEPNVRQDLIPRGATGRLLSCTPDTSLWNTGFNNIDSSLWLHPCWTFLKDMASTI